MGRQAPASDSGAGWSGLGGESFKALHPRPGVPWPLVLVLIPALAGLAGLFIRADGAFEAIARPGPLGRWEGLLIA
ncbi:MAG: hypothetical protein GXP41_00075, partial [Chloroflexi bacterium]|nr:hypothetical protein [Chloroflexota bacterium]